MFSSAKQLLARANRRGLRRAVAALAMVAFWCIGPVSAVATPTVVARANLAPGVSYSRIDDPAIPITPFVLVSSPGYPATLDGVLSAGKIGGYERTSVMAKAAGALAAINGDLTSSPGRPPHQYVLDGHVMQTGMRVGVSFGFRQDEAGGTVGHHPIRI